VPGFNSGCESVDGSSHASIEDWGSVFVTRAEHDANIHTTMTTEAIGCGQFSQHPDFLLGNAGLRKMIFHWLGRVLNHLLCELGFVHMLPEVREDDSSELSRSL
jgi:hypothetical protein